MKMKKALTAARRSLLRRDILAALEGGRALYRREINKQLLTQYGFDEGERTDNTPNSRKNLLFSAVGTILSDLCREGALLRSAEGRYTLTRESVIAIHEAECREEILAFCEGGRYTKREIYTHIEQFFGTDRTDTESDDLAARSLCGRLLDRLVAEGELYREGDGLRRAESTDEFFPAEDGAGLCRRYLTLLQRQGGAFLERFAVTLLCDYYARTGRTVTLAEVSGGSQDGGIDGRIDTVDALGFSERVLIQTKCRREALHVTEREVRGFYGAVCAAGGSRGIFVTTSVFHKGAKRFLDGIPNCVGIDGEGLFAIARQCGFGIRREGDGYIINRRVFSESL